MTQKELFLTYKMIQDLERSNINFCTIHANKYTCNCLYNIKEVLRKDLIATIPVIVDNYIVYWNHQTNDLSFIEAKELT